MLSNTNMHEIEYTFPPKKKIQNKNEITKSKTENKLLF